MVASNITISYCLHATDYHTGAKSYVMVLQSLQKKSCWKTVKPAVHFSSLNLHSSPGTFTTIFGLNLDLPGSSGHFTTKLVQVYVYSITKHQTTVVTGT